MRRRFLFSLPSVLLLAATSVSGQSVLRNGDFEGGLNHWRFSDPQAIALRSGIRRAQPVGHADDQAFVFEFEKSGDVELIQPILLPILRASESFRIGFALRLETPRVTTGKHAEITAHIGFEASGRRRSLIVTQVATVGHRGFDRGRVTQITMYGDVPPALFHARVGRLAVKVFCISNGGRGIVSIDDVQLERVFQPATGVDGLDAGGALPQRHVLVSQRDHLMAASTHLSFAALSAGPAIRFPGLTGDAWRLPLSGMVFLGARTSSSGITTIRLDVPILRSRPILVQSLLLARNRATQVGSAGVVRLR